MACAEAASKIYDVSLGGGAAAGADYVLFGVTRSFAPVDFLS